MTAQQSGSHVDILIVGGGMVGATLALKCQGLPWSVALVDPRKPPQIDETPAQSAADFHPRVSALSRHSERILADINVWSSLSKDRIGTYQRMRVWDHEGTAELDFKPEILNLNALGHIIENRHVEQQLWQALQSSTVQCFNETRVTRAIRPEQPESCWEVSLEDGTQLRCQLLLIADGARSQLRDELGFQQRQWSYQQTAVVANVHHSLEHQATAWQAFHRSGPLAFLPLAIPNASAIVWSLDDAVAETFLASSSAEQAHALTLGMSHRLGQVELAGEIHRFPLIQQHSIHYIQPGVALLGDAAHSIHPLAGQGVNIGLLDVEAMAEVLHAAAQQQWPLSEYLILRRYQRQRQGHNLNTMLAMEGLKRLFGANHSALHLVRNAGMRLFAQQPRLLKKAIQMASGL